MEGFYVAHRATCQGCSAAHHAKESKPLAAAETLFVVDDAPEKNPKPEMTSIRKG